MIVLANHFLPENQETGCKVLYSFNKVVFFFSSKQNLVEELDGLQADLTALKLKNEELMVSHQNYTQEVCFIYVLL